MDQLSPDKSPDKSAEPYALTHALKALKIATEARVKIIMPFEEAIALLAHITELKVELKDQVYKMEQSANKPPDHTTQNHHSHFSVALKALTQADEYGIQATLSYEEVEAVLQYINRSADQPAPNHNTYRLAQLTQLSHGPVHASNLLSSIDRDALVRIGWAFRAGEGWNCITPEGVMICVNLGILRTA